MTFTVIDQYNSFVENNFIKSDNDQIKILNDINIVWKKNKRKRYFIKSKNIDGIYLHGAVGIGKTFLLNLFYQNTKVGKKIHFNNLMLEIHQNVKDEKNKELAIENYVKKLSIDFKVLFIDEMHIFNIVDALIIKKIFLFFAKYKIFILISSNFSPGELYKDGLQRNDFIPFINYIKKNYQVITTPIKIDYRRQMLNQSKTYFSPINNETKNEFLKLFNKFIDSAHLITKVIKTKSRNLTLTKCTANIVMTSFNQVCNANLGHEDYKNIAKNFSLIFLENVPDFIEENKDSCRRFISFIDMLYENNCSIVILASKPIAKLNNINSLLKEFERTTSRLYEMTIIKPN